MKIHFVCTGNVFRSRLAEAYLKSKNIADLVISSSGTEAQNNIGKSIEKYTVIVSKNHNIEQFLSDYWVQTAKEGIEQQDLVIFMQPIHYEFCHDRLGCKVSNYEIWDVQDIPDELSEKTPVDMDTIIALAEDGFQKIKSGIDTLISNGII